MMHGKTEEIDQLLVAYRNGMIQEASVCTLVRYPCACTKLDQETSQCWINDEKPDKCIVYPKDLLLISECIGLDPNELLIPGCGFYFEEK